MMDMLMWQWRGGSCGDRSRRREILDPGTPWDDPVRADVLDDDCDVNDDASECCMGTRCLSRAAQSRRQQSRRNRSRRGRKRTQCLQACDNPVVHGRHNASPSKSPLCRRCTRTMCRSPKELENEKRRQVTKEKDTRQNQKSQNPLRTPVLEM